MSCLLDWAKASEIRHPLMSVVETTPRTASCSSKPWPELRTGDWVCIRDADEIAGLLDDAGRTGGLSFMPEMAAYCGKSFRVGRAGTTVCINSESNYMGRIDDCFVLQTKSRCDGGFHGGCQMACQFLWKPAWLKPSDPPRGGQVSSGVAVNSDADLTIANSDFADRLSKFVTVSAKVYRCQATQLVQIASPTPVHNVKQYADENRRSGIKLRSIIRFASGVVKKKVLRQSGSVVGTCENKTPQSTQKLEVGDLVRVKSLDEIRQTLDKQGCNRGLWFDPDEMAPLCGKELRVSRVIEKLIDERNGKLRNFPSHTVVLSEIACSGVFKRFCSRGLFHFWRTIWVEKIDE